MPMSDDDALEHLARLARRRRVVDQCRDRRFLIAAQKIGTVDRAMRLLALDRDMRVLTRQPGACR